MSSQGDVAALSPMKSSVRRCLFGPIDHDEVKRFHAHEMAVLEQRDRSKYNFDFRSETPLFGRYIWQRVAACAVDVPRCYEMATQFGVRESKPSSPSSSTDTTTTTITTTSTVTTDTSRTDVGKEEEEKESQTIVTTKPSSSSMKRKQSLISECFSQKKKRHCSTVGTAKRRLDLNADNCNA